MVTGITFNNARGAASSLQMMPPFAFNDVTMTVFPLQASTARLSNFFDQYLNLAPELVRFDPFMPYVYLVILDYGQMAAAAANTGWVSQREVAFGVPLRWMVPNGEGAMALHDIAFCSPFIFVDNELSMSTGREVYGWPKLLGRFDAAISDWVEDPHGARRVFEVSAPRDIGGGPGRPFLTVAQTALSGLADMPPRLDTATQALSALPGTAATLARLAADLTRTAGSTAADLLKLSFGVPGAEAPAPLASILRSLEKGMAGDLDALMPRLGSNTINFKQFRDAANPMVACYQAITAARMPVTRIGAGGLLGPLNQLAGQVDGGYRVHVHDNALLPLVSALGLQSAPGDRAKGGPAATLTPTCPFWLKLDMTYGLGETLAWRARSGPWRPGEGSERIARARAAAAKSDEAAPEKDDGHADAPEETPDHAHASAEADAHGKAGAQEHAHGHHHHAADDDADHLFDPVRPDSLFNNARGGSEALGGVFRMPGAEIRVMPLKADKEVLARFVSGYLDVPGHLRVEPWGDFVYVIVANYDRSHADARPGPALSMRRVRFSVPVKCYAPLDGADPNAKPPSWVSAGAAERWRKGADGLIGVALTTPFAYADDAGVAITDSEVSGVPTLRSGITSPPQGWADAPDDDGVLLETRALVLPTVGTGAEGVRETLVQVREGPALPDRDAAGWRRAAAGWGKTLADDIDAKARERGDDGFDALGRDQSRKRDPNPFDVTRSLALGLLAGERAVVNLSLKQFRDAEKPTDACYQALVMGRTRIDSIRELSEIERGLTVSITRYPTQPIAQILGLIPKRSHVTDLGVVDEFEPLRPFLLCGDLVQETGRTLYESVGGERWEPVELMDGPLAWQPSSVEELEEHAKACPIPLCRYDCLDDDTGKLVRSHPLSLTPERLEVLRLKRERASGDVSAVHLLCRDLKVEALTDPQAANALDDCIAEGPAATLAALRQRGSLGQEAARDLAGSLELVSPATVLDAILSRSARLEGVGGAFASAKEDYCVRADALGPDLGAALFPRKERQRGYWPAPRRHAVASMRRRWREGERLDNEFWSVVEWNQRITDDAWLEKLARDMMPPWFGEGVKTAGIRMGPVLDFFNALNDDQLTEIRSSLRALLREARGRKPIAEGVLELIEDLAKDVTAIRALPHMSHLGELLMTDRAGDILRARLAESALGD